MKKISIVFILLAFLLHGKAQTDLIISELVEGWSNNKALEIFNPTNTAISMGTYRLVRYSNGADIPVADPTWTVRLPNRNVPPYSSYVVVLDKRVPTGTGQEAPVWSQLAQRADTFACPVYDVSKTMYFNGNDAVTIEKQSGANWVMVDIFGRWGAPPCVAGVEGTAYYTEAWTETSPYFSGIGVPLTADHTLIRKSSVKNGVKTNPSLFNTLAEYDTLKANTFTKLGWHKFDLTPANSTPALVMSKSVYYVSPTAQNGTSLGSVTATDNESNSLRFYVDNGNFVYFDHDGNALTAEKRYEPFGLNRATGQLTVVDKSGLLPAVKTVFYLETTVTDGFSQSNPELIKVIVTDAGPVTALSIASPGSTVIVHRNSPVQLTANITPVITLTSDPRYTWKVNNSNASISATGLLTGLVAGSVTVTCTAVDGSGIVAEKVFTVVDYGLGFSGINSVPVTIYPNPAEGSRFRISSSKEFNSLVITDLAGREVFRKSFGKAVISSEVEMVSTAKGIFMVSVHYMDNSQSVSKLVIR